MLNKDKNVFANRLLNDESKKTQQAVASPESENIRGKNVYVPETVSEA